VRVRSLSSPGCPNWPREGHASIAERSTAPPLTKGPSSAFRRENPKHGRRGEKKGYVAPSVPGMGNCFKESIARR